MARQRFDIGSKWLLHNQGKGAMLVGGLTGVTRIEAMPGELVQNRKYPDGLLRVFLRGNQEPNLVLTEVATYPERRAQKQALDELALAYSALGQLPELLMLVLRPKGKFRIGASHEIQSKLGLSRLKAEWRTVELWTLRAEEFLAAGDVGVVPWVPLMQFDGATEDLLERCARKIEREAQPKEQADLLAVSQVMTGLRFSDPALLTFFRGEQTMIESPVLQRWRAGAFHEAILAILKDRFKAVPRDVTKPVRELLDEKRLTRLTVLAAKCPDLDRFRDALLT